MPIDTLQKIHWGDENGNICSDIALDDYFLTDGEKIVIRQGDESQEVVLSKHISTMPAIHFGGVIHGLKYNTITSTYYYRDEEQLRFIEFLDDAKFYRIESPKGMNISSTIDQVS
jgi:hypothetical protein